MLNLSEDLEDDGFEFEPEPIKKQAVKKPVTVPAPPKQEVQIVQQPAQVVYIDNEKLVKALQDNNEALGVKIEELVHAFNSKPKSFKLKINRDINARMESVDVRVLE